MSLFENLMLVNSITDLYKSSEDAAVTGNKKMTCLYIRDNIFSRLFAFGWEPGDVMTNALEKVIVIT